MGCKESEATEQQQQYARITVLSAIYALHSFNTTALRGRYRAKSTVGCKRQSQNQFEVYLPPKVGLLTAII